MRIQCSDEEDRPGQFALYQANTRRSIRGKRGQAALREMLAALEAMPVKALIADDFVRDGMACAVAAVAVERDVQAGMSREAALAKWEEESDDDNDPESYTIDIAEWLGIPSQVAWQLVFENDETTSGMTPEQRHERMVAWIRARLIAPETT